MSHQSLIEDHDDIFSTTDTGSRSSSSSSDTTYDSHGDLVNRTPKPCGAQFGGFILNFLKATTQADGPLREADVLGGCYRIKSGRKKIGCRSVLPGPVIVSVLFAAASLAGSYFGPDKLLNGTEDTTGIYPEDRLGLIMIPLAFMAKDLTFQVYRFFNGLRGLFCNSNVPLSKLHQPRNGGQKCGIFLLGLLRILCHEIPSTLVYGILVLTANPLLLNIMDDMTQLAINIAVGVVTNFLTSVRTARLWRYSPFAMGQQELIEPEPGDTNSLQLYQKYQPAYKARLKSVRAFNIYGCLPLVAVGLLKHYLLDPLQMQSTAAGQADLGSVWCLLSCFLLTASIALIPELSLGFAAIWSCMQCNFTRPNQDGVIHLLGQVGDKLNMALFPVALCAALRSLSMLRGPDPIALVESDDYMNFCTGVSVAAGVGPLVTYGINTGYRHSAQAGNRERSTTSTHHAVTTNYTDFNC